jgi:DNA uptake protein ComE-like DNA-binding protein
MVVEQDSVPSIWRTLAVSVSGAVALAFAVPCVAEDNSQNLADVKAVCTRCHTADAFLSTPRSWQRWNDVFHQMMERGATGTESQLAGVTEYFLSNLTIINVNTSPADEIEWVLNATPSVRDFIVERRVSQKFTSLGDLSSVPGIDQERVRRLGARILF